VGGSKTTLVAHENITQTVHVVDQKGKPAMLRRVVRNLPDDHKTLVFVRMKTLCDEISAEYLKQGHKCDALHGNREQADRTSSSPLVC
jgi:superfamily II DNA/RNA helicase